MTNSTYDSSLLRSAMTFASPAFADVSAAAVDPRIEEEAASVMAEALMYRDMLQDAVKMGKQGHELAETAIGRLKGLKMPAGSRYSGTFDALLNSLSGVLVALEQAVVDAYDGVAGIVEKGCKAFGTEAGQRFIMKFADAHVREYFTRELSAEKYEGAVVERQADGSYIEKSSETLKGADVREAFTTVTAGAFQGEVRKEVRDGLKLGDHMSKEEIAKTQEALGVLHKKKNGEICGKCHGRERYEKLEATHNDIEAAKKELDEVAKAQENVARLERGLQHAEEHDPKNHAMHKIMRNQKERAEKILTKEEGDLAETLDKRVVRGAMMEQREERREERRREQQAKKDEPHTKHEQGVEAQDPTHGLHAHAGKRGGFERGSRITA